LVRGPIAQATTTGNLSIDHYEALFAPSFKVQIPYARMAEFHREIFDAHGACRPGAMLEVNNPRDAWFGLQCDRGAFAVHIGLDLHTPGRIQLYQIVAESAYEPTQPDSLAPKRCTTPTPAEPPRQKASADP
jgi:hypothetical protein